MTTHTSHTSVLVFSTTTSHSTGTLAAANRPPSWSSISSEDLICVKVSPFPVV
jgi:hypothetical protein